MKLLDVLNVLACDQTSLLCIWQFISDNDCVGERYMYNHHKGLHLPEELLDRTVIELMVDFTTLHITLDKDILEKYSTLEKPDTKECPIKGHREDGEGNY